MYSSATIRSDTFADVLNQCPHTHKFSLVLGCVSLLTLSVWSMCIAPVLSLDTFIPSKLHGRDLRLNPHGTIIIVVLSYEVALMTCTGLGLFQFTNEPLAKDPDILWYPTERFRYEGAIIYQTL